jgi:hypothetical protein
MSITEIVTREDMNLFAVQPPASPTRMIDLICQRLRFVAIAAMIACTACTAEQAAAQAQSLSPSKSAATGISINPLFNTLLQPAPGDPVQLQPPRFTDHQSAEQQLAVLRQVGGDRHPVEALLRPNVLTPHVLTMERQPLGEYDAIAQRVSVVFALRGELEMFTRESFLDSLLSGAAQADGDDSAGTAAVSITADDQVSRGLTAEELRAAGITPPDPQQDDRSSQHFRLVRGELFSRVKFSGVVQSYATRTDQSVLLAIRFDNRFPNVPGLRGVWQRLERDDAGRMQVAQQGDFLGGGAYVKITRWQDDPQLLLFEAEMLLLEPHAWFGGSNLLGSKLPPAIQSQVRAIRRSALRALQ